MTAKLQVAVGGTLNIALYAEDLEWGLHNRFARVLPRGCSCLGTGVEAGHMQDHQTCGGVGFLYPDPPDWYYTEYGEDAAASDDWKHLLEVLWRVLGIVEDTE